MDRWWVRGGKVEDDEWVVIENGNVDGMMEHKNEVLFEILRDLSNLSNSVRAERVRYWTWVAGHHFPKAASDSPNHSFLLSSKFSNKQ